MAAKKRGPKQSKSRALVPSSRGVVEVIDGQTGKREKVQKDDSFTLESGPNRGEIPERVVSELCHARTVAKDYASSYSDACKAMALKYSVKAGALKRYIAAKTDDKLDEAEAENDDLAKLLGA